MIPEDPAASAAGAEASAAAEADTPAGAEATASDQYDNTDKECRQRVLTEKKGTEKVPFVE